MKIKYILSATTFLGLVGATGAMAQTTTSIRTEISPQVNLSFPVNTEQQINTVPQNDFERAAAATEERLGDLDRAGVHLRGQVIEELASNPVGGVSQGGTSVGQLQFGADLNLNKLLNIPGATFHITVYQDFGDSLSLQSLGTSFKVQEIYKNAFEHVHLGLFAWEQRLFDNRIDIVAGRVGTTSYFGRLSEFCNFTNGADCGVPIILKSQSGFTLLPSATWGGKSTFNLTHNVYAAVGLFEVNPFIAHTFGTDFSVNHATGETVPVEIGYHSVAGETPYPFSIKVGEVYSDGPHTDPFLNTKGQSLGLHGGTAKAINIRNTLYILGDKMVWHAKDAPSKVSIFGGYVQQLDLTEVYRSQAIAGVLWSAPFHSRPRDTTGIEVNYFEVSSKELEFLRDSRTKAGGSGNNNPNEFDIELNYGFAVTREIRFSPSIQYVINPDNASLPKTARIPANALVIGAQFVVNIGGMFGIPSATASD